MKVWVLTRLDIQEGVDVEHVLADMDYSFSHSAILDTEIIEVSYESEEEMAYVPKYTKVEYTIGPTEIFGAEYHSVEWTSDETNS